MDPLVTGSPRRCWKRLGNLQADRRGVATIEYAFLASLIAVSLVASFALLGAAVTGHFDRVSDAVERSLGSHYQSGN